MFNNTINACKDTDMNSFMEDNIICTNSHDLRIDNFDAPPIIDANIENVIPRTQSWADTTASSPPAIFLCCLQALSSSAWRETRHAPQIIGLS